MVVHNFLLCPTCHNNWFLWEALSAKKDGFWKWQIGRNFWEANLVKLFSGGMKKGRLYLQAMGALIPTRISSRGDEGGSLKALQELLGHDEFKTTSDTYAHVTEDHLQEAVNLVKLGPLDLFTHKK